MLQTKPLRWVSWAAVSSQPQATPDKVSIPLQLETNRLHADKHGGQIVAELVVPGESRSIATWEEACHRVEAYAQLRDLLGRRAFDVLAYYDASRLARTLSLGSTIRELCTRAGVILYETTNPPNELRAGWRHNEALIGAINAVGAQEEVAKLVARRAAGMIGRTLRGEFQAQPNYGYAYRYTPDGGREIVLDERAAAAVRLLFRLYLSGMGQTVIANVLNIQGHLSPTGAQWTGGNVASIIQRAEVYAGYSVLNAKSKKGAQVVRGHGKWPALLSDDDWRAVESERIQRRDNRNLPVAPMRLSSVCYCAVCGGVMHYRRVFPEYTPRLKAPLAYLRCIRHRPTLSLQERAVIEALDAAIDTLDGADLDAVAMESIDPLAELRAQLADSEAQGKAIDESLRRIDDAYTAGLMDMDRYAAQVRAIQERAERNQAELLRLQAQLTDSVAAGTRRQRLGDVRDYGRAMLSSDDVAASNRWLRRHVRVYCTAGEVAAVIWL